MFALEGLGRLDRGDPATKILVQYVAQRLLVRRARREVSAVFEMVAHHDRKALEHH